MVSVRRCSRPACKHPAVYTLTYVYRDSTAVLGPLAAYVEPHCYDLCSAHADRLTAPRGWEVVRLPVEPVPPTSIPWPAGEPVGQGIEVGRRGHLRVLRSSPDSPERLR
jgi:hypothetical protein